MDISGNVTVGNLFRTQPQYQHQGQTTGEDASTRPELAPEDRAIVAAKQPLPTGETPEAHPDDHPPEEETDEESESKEELKRNAQDRDERRGKSRTGDERRELSPEEQRKVRNLRDVDESVRAHVSGHLAAAGGLNTGGAGFRYVHGPDGQRYAADGEVNLGVSKASTPEATIAKMKKIQVAALAAPDPSSQDRSAAARAAAMEREAKRELYAPASVESEQTQTRDSSEIPEQEKETSTRPTTSSTTGAAVVSAKADEGQKTQVKKSPPPEITTPTNVLESTNWLPDAFQLLPLGIDVTPEVPFRAVPELGIPAREAIATISREPSHTAQEIATHAYERANFTSRPTRRVNEVA